MIKPIAFALTLLLPWVAVAALPVPDNGLRAEMAGRWQDAMEIYQQALKTDPMQSHLWLRISDIEAHLGNPIAAADAITQATRYSPDDPALFHRLAQARANANQKKAAMAAIERAVELAPDNVEYLHARALHANWNAKYDVSQASYQRILEIKPGEADAMLGIARSYNWQEDFEQSALAYDAYIEKYPEDQKALMEYVEVEAELGNYEGALILGERYRQRYGEDMNYWLHMSDIYALSGNDRAAADAIEKASQYAPDDPALFFRLAQSYPSIKDVKRALAAVMRAVELEPDNLTYLRGQADLAAWAGEYDTAITSYHRILEIEPDDAGALLGIARTNSWQGHTDEAIAAYQIYLDKFPQVQVVWIEYIQLHSETGNYDVAIALLEEYRERFGDNNAYYKQRAQIFAWAQRPERALSIVASLRPQLPDDYALHTINTIALNNNHQPREAVGSLAELNRLDPDSPETLGTQLFVRTPLRSHANLFGSYQTDTDDITIKRLGVEAVYVDTPKTRYWLAGEQIMLDAPIGGGLENVDGSADVDYTRVWAGGRHMASPRWALDASIGNGSVENGKSHFIYEIGADLWPQDGLSMRLSRTQDIYAVSPRAVSLNILRRANQLDISWSANLLYTVDAQLAISDYSDDNERWDFAIAPRRAIIRSQHFSLDLGMGAHWFAFDQTLNNGYYSPLDYERYSVAAYTAWWFNENDGINTSISIGPYKDNTMSSSRSAGDITVEGIWGVYRDWMLTVSASLSQNTGIDTGAYRSRLFAFVLTKRF